MGIQGRGRSWLLAIEVAHYSQTCLQDQTLFWTHENDTPGALHTLTIKINDSKYHKHKPSDVDLKESPIRWLLALVIATMAIIIRTWLSG